MAYEEVNAGREEFSSGRSYGRTADGGTGGILKHTVDEALERAKLTGEKIVEDARGSVRSLLDDQFKRAGEELGDVASAVRQASGRLKETEWKAAAEYTDKAASQVERLSEYLHEKHFGELLEDAGELLRHRPGLFIAGAFTVGFLLARFLNSSMAAMEETAEARDTTPRYPMASTGVSSGRGAGAEDALH